MKILLDTNFILTCAKQKIDFQEITDKIVSEKIEWLVPQDVLNEIKNKQSAELSLEIIKKLTPKIINLPTKNPNIDIKIANYISNKPIILATMDKKLKSRVKNKILTIRNKKFLKII